MLPPIGSVSMLAAQGRAGVVVDARPIGEAEGGRQLVALRIKADATSGGDAKARTKTDGRQDHTLSAGSASISGGAQRSANAAAGPVAAKLPDQLNAAERADVTRLQQRDQQVRQEEKAHAAVAGDLAGPISYTYQLGPDGRQYAVGGSVGVQASAASGDPAEAKRLSGRMAAAANAATNPSAQDYATARQAYAFGSQLTVPTTAAKEEPGLSLTL